MTITNDYCPHCETPYDDERDENGLPFCTCPQAEIERLTDENHRLKLILAKINRVISLLNHEIAPYLKG